MLLKFKIYVFLTWYVGIYFLESYMARPPHFLVQEGFDIPLHLPPAHLHFELFYSIYLARKYL